MLDKFFSYPQYVPRPPGFGLRQVHVIGIHHHIEVSTLAISIATKQIYIYISGENIDIKEQCIGLFRF